METTMARTLTGRRIHRKALSAQNDKLELPKSLQQPKESVPRLKICIVGAGVTGLYTAMMLEFLNIPGLSYEILESSDRVGGRVYTHYFNEDKHQYFDVGAMRFPRIPAMKRYASYSVFAPKC